MKNSQNKFAFVSPPSLLAAVFSFGAMRLALAAFGVFPVNSVRAQDKPTEKGNVDAPDPVIRRPDQLPQRRQLDGKLNSGDIGLVKSKSGTALA